MRKVFLDTNILLDVILRRDVFFEQSVAVWSDCENHKVQGHITAISLNNIHFIMRKLVVSDAALEYVRLVFHRAPG